MENQWQPIETAPKDGSKFLMFITGMGYKKKNSDKKYRAKTIQKVLIANYSPQTNSFYGEDGDFTTIINEFNFKEEYKTEGIGYCGKTNIQATHWMPLPKPPIINN